MRIAKVNDDGWIPTTLVCIAGATVAAGRGVRRPGRFLSGILAGVLYEQLVEWAAHGWLQSEPVEGLEFFRWRHGRHHVDPQNHHALQPISIWTPVVAVLLFPALILSTSPRKRSAIASGMISGFLLAHAALNIEHYDIHAQRKVVPNVIRGTKYYSEVVRIHLAHHDGVELRIYGITNPWLDMLLERVGASSLMDRLFQRIGKWAARLDGVWLTLDPTWREVVRKSSDGLGSGLK
jgi:hypothetical protein